MKPLHFIFTFMALLAFSCERTSNFNDELLKQLAELNSNRINNFIETTEQMGVPYAGVKRMDLFLSDWHKVIKEHLSLDSIPTATINDHINRLEKQRWDDDADVLIDLFKRNLDKSDVTSVVLNEIELLDRSLELLNSNFRLFDIALPVVVGDRNLKLNQTDTLKFVFQGVSRYLRNIVYFGKIDELMESTEGIEEATEFSNELFANYHVIKATERGQHELTGVMVMFDRGGELKLPFRYVYTVE